MFPITMYEPTEQLKCSIFNKLFHDVTMITACAYTIVLGLDYCIHKNTII